MRSRAESRVWLEHALRAVVVLALAVLLWQSLREFDTTGGRAISARELDTGMLTEWSATPGAPRIHLDLDRVPSAIERRWLIALNGMGRVTWEGDLPSLMVSVQPLAAPGGGSNILMAVPSRSSVALTADGGATNTMAAEHGGTTVTLGSPANYVTALVRGSFASTAQRDSIRTGRLVVIGRPGWEAKFVVAALEEDGWKVDALIRVAPGVDVTQGSTAVIDTARYSTVIALDGAAAPYANRIAEFARLGGGVVLAPRAASLGAMAGLRAGTVGRTPPDSRGGVPGEHGIRSLQFVPITSLTNDAVPLETRSAAVVTAARRIGAGRAMQVGYEDTWRWRMSGGEDGVREHRQWWTRIVSDVAYAPRMPRRAGDRPTDEAPVLSLVAGLGPSTSQEDMASLTGSTSDWMAWLLMLLGLVLIGEVASRRLRGAG